MRMFGSMQSFFFSHGVVWSRSIPDIDQQLYDKYGITEDEQKFIESMIKPME